ncbi:hypothetical protein EIP91_008817 [Steccherinum ochraceum]|uniref:NAD(P)-binding domain-containing protein n=1 Tax=Steccherinum ochraceum TaxID=92696 RepID=A0A4R0R500_9APHY|nr:hypothetical protein EIP91_008817 [Steccherinum ochraceum]
MRLLVTGATGAAGLNIYRAALNDSSVTSVTLLLRREMPSWAVLPANASEKTTTILHSDFASYPADVASRLAQHDACIWALGTSSNGVAEADYTRITYEYPMAMVKALKEAGVGNDRPADKPFRFVYFSGEMADPTGKSGQMWARVKGKTEKDLASFCVEGSGMRVHSIRPAFFGPNKEYPEDKKHQRAASRRALDAVMGPVLNITLPSYVTPIPDLTASTLAIAQGKYPDRELFRNTDLRKIAKKLKARS